MAKILVLYFSRADENYFPNGIHAVAEGNTAKLAQAIAQAAGADIFEVKTDHRYPKAYHACTEEAKKLSDVVGHDADRSHGLFRTACR